MSENWELLPRVYHRIFLGTWSRDAFRALTPEINHLMYHKGGCRLPSND